MANPYCIVLVTVPDAAVAEKAAMALLNEKLAACVNEVPHIVSRYRWEGKIERSNELLLLIKTRIELLKDLTRCVKKIHPYSVPEIVGLGVSGGLKEYLDWIAGCVRAPERPTVKSKTAKKGRVPTASGGGTSAPHGAVGRVPTASGGGTSAPHGAVGRVP